MRMQNKVGYYIKNFKKINKKKYFYFFFNFLNTWKKALNINEKKILIAIYNLPRFFYELYLYKKKLKNSSKISKKSFDVKLTTLKPILNDWNEESGEFGSYFHQDLWAAQKVFKKSPQKHVDIGSRIDGFVSHLLVFTEVIEIDIRPLNSRTEGLTFIQSDATKLDSFDDDSIESLSSLHVAEHFGLGRYGDKVDPDACFTFMKTLQRVLSPNGTLLFSVPIGEDVLFFNANRKFHPQTIIETFNELELISASAISKNDRLEKNISIEKMSENQFRVGLFEFKKR